MSAHPGHRHDRRVNVPDLLDRMLEGPSGSFHLIAVLLCLVGVAGFIAGLLGDPARAWTALVWNWAFWSGLSLAGAVLVAAATASRGAWLRPLRRFAEALTAFLPVSYVIMIVLFFGLEHVYVWVAHPPPVKAPYLNPTFFIVREAVLVAVLYGLALALVYWSMRPDLGRLGDRVGGWRAGLYGRLTGGWQGLDPEVERAHRNRSRLAPALVVAWALVWTMWAWDWLMSVDPHWFSTLFGAWIFMTHFLAAIGATAILACLLRGYRSFSEAVDRRALHDIGKMLFAFTVFWTYLFFAQYLVIWYGRLPEETHFVELRLWGAYQPVATIVFAAVFLVPFLGLLGVRPKRTPALLTAFALISLIGIWLFHFLIVAPGVFPDFVAFGWIELAVAAGLFGAFALSTIAFLSAFPAIAIAAGLPADPESEKLAELTEPHHH
ncbi:MAG TPA: hypothetical protein VM737_12480 [Gemmatimonadota bacterium]|nr:hypothetical protein [Gemmatimonadota bacterium]